MSQDDTGYCTCCYQPLHDCICPSDEEMERWWHERQKIKWRGNVVPVDKADFADVLREMASPE